MWHRICLLAVELLTLELSHICGSVNDGLLLPMVTMSQNREARNLLVCTVVHGCCILIKHPINIVFIDKIVKRVYSLRCSMIHERIPSILPA